MEFEELSQKAIEIRAKYNELDKKEFGLERTRSQIMQGFIVDVGELMELVMAKEGLKDIENLDKKLAHELADCLYCVMVLAMKYGVDLEREFLKTMDELSEKIDKKLEK